MVKCLIDGEMQKVFMPETEEQKKQILGITAGMTASGVPAVNPYTSFGYIMAKNNIR